ncbi:MAG: hypothetical protein ACE5GA_00965 [Candidatus Zixiibacteriota bacterium]
MTRNETSANNTDDLGRIEALIELMYDDLLVEGGRFKVSELLKAIELKRKLAPADDREKRFWSMIDEIRAAELGASRRHNKKKRRAGAGSEQALTQKGAVSGAS